MAGYKANRNTQHVQHKRYHCGGEVKPTLYTNTRGKSVMAGSAHGELVRDVRGNVVPWRSIQSVRGPAVRVVGESVQTIHMGWFFKKYLKHASKTMRF